MTMRRGIICTVNFVERRPKEKNDRSECRNTVKLSLSFLPFPSKTRSFSPISTDVLVSTIFIS